MKVNEKKLYEWWLKDGRVWVYDTPAIRATVWQEPQVVITVGKRPNRKIGMRPNIRDGVTTVHTTWLSIEKSKETALEMIVEHCKEMERLSRLTLLELGEVVNG